MGWMRWALVTKNVVPDGGGGDDDGVGCQAWRPVTTTGRRWTPDYESTWTVRLNSLPHSGSGGEDGDGHVSFQAVTHTVLASGLTVCGCVWFRPGMVNKCLEVQGEASSARYGRIRDPLAFQLDDIVGLGLARLLGLD